MYMYINNTIVYYTNSIIYMHVHKKYYNIIYIILVIYMYIYNTIIQYILIFYERVHK